MTKKKRRHFTICSYVGLSGSQVSSQRSKVTGLSMQSKRRHFPEQLGSPCSQQGMFFFYIVKQTISLKSFMQVLCNLYTSKADLFAFS